MQDSFPRRVCGPVENLTFAILCLQLNLSPVSGWHLWLCPDTALSCHPLSLIIFSSGVQLPTAASPAQATAPSVSSPTDEWFKQKSVVSPSGGSKSEIEVSSEGGGRGHVARLPSGSWWLMASFSFSRTWLICASATSLPSCLHAVSLCVRICVRFFLFIWALGAALLQSDLILITSAMT